MQKPTNILTGSEVDRRMSCNVLQSAHLQSRVACGITTVLFHLEVVWVDERIYASHSFAARNSLRAFMCVWLAK